MSTFAHYHAKAGRCWNRLRLRWFHLRQPRVVRWRGLKIAVGDHMSQDCADCLALQTYEQGEARIVSRFLNADDVVFEVGTGLGAIALTCSKRIGADRVHTFEANPGLEKHILKNFELNSLFPHHQMCLLGEGPGERDFFTASSFELSTAVKQVAGTKVTRTPTRSLNDELRRVDPTFLIVDIEGGEYEFFQTLDQFGRIRKIAIELHPHLIGEEKIATIKERLAHEGFVIDPRYSVGQQVYAARTG